MYLFAFSFYFIFLAESAHNAEEMRLNGTMTREHKEKRVSISKPLNPFEVKPRVVYAERFEGKKEKRKEQKIGFLVKLASVIKEQRPRIDEK